MLLMTLGCLYSSLLFYALQMTVFLINKIRHIQQYLRLEKVTSVLGHDFDSQANTCVL